MISSASISINVVHSACVHTRASVCANPPKFKCKSSEMRPRRWHGPIKMHISDSYFGLCVCVSATLVRFHFVALSNGANAHCFRIGDCHGIFTPENWIGCVRHLMPWLLQNKLVNFYGFMTLYVQDCAAF